jgi:prolipoprotein diacylglyceryl transferase
MELMLSYITWDVSPEILSFGPITMRWYGLLFASGFLIGFYIVQRMFQKEGAPEPWLEKVFMYMVLGTVVGARLGHVFFYEWGYYSQHLSEIPQVWKGGLASHGGAIGIILALYIFSRTVSKRSILWILDKVVVPTALAGCFIRLGNLMNSEIYGIPTEAAWGFKFIRTDAEALVRHPVQLYESIAYLASFFILFYTYWKTDKRHKLGYIFGLFLVLIFSARFFLEQFKSSQGGFESALGNVLTTGQWLSIPFVLGGAYFMFVAKETKLPPFPKVADPNKDKKKRKAKK